MPLRHIWRVVTSSETHLAPPALLQFSQGILLCLGLCANFPLLKKNILFLERGEGRKRGSETSMHGCLSRTPHWGLGTPPRHCARAGNGTSDPLVCRAAPYPRSHTSQSKIFPCYNDLSHNGSGPALMTSS